MDLCLVWLLQSGVIMPNLPKLITSNGTDITPIMEEMISYLKEEKELGNLDKIADVKVPLTSSADWSFAYSIISLNTGVMSTLFTDLTGTISFLLVISNSPLFN